MTAFLSLLTALGWSLLDSIWQMAALWVAYGLLTAGCKRFSAAEKHNLALLFVLMGSSWFLFSLVEYLNEPREHFISGFIPVSVKTNRWIPYLSGVYLIIITGRFVQSGFQYYKRNKCNSGLAASPVMQSFADCQSRLMGISRKVNVYISELAETAETCGYLKPVILLPVSLVTKLSTRQLEAILTHELLHIRRNDYIINICMTCYRGIFFFNPFARFFYTAVARERELACDDGVLEMRYEADLYADALFCLEKYRHVHPDFSLAVDGNRPWLLMERIRRLLGNTIIEKKQIRPVMIINGMMALCLFCLQQKSAPPVAIVPLSKHIITTKPVQYKLRAVEISRLDHELAVKIHARNLNKKSKTVPEWKTELITNAEPVEASETENPSEQIYFADHNEARDYSNQPAAPLTVEPIPAIPGTPYVASSSLSYESIPETAARDSIPQLIIPDGMQKLIADTRIEVATSLKKMETELQKNNRQFRAMEIRDQKLIELHKKDIRPILRKIRIDLKNKKQEIDRLKIQLQVTDQEIIHI